MPVKTKFKINSKKEYHETMAFISAMMEKKESTLSKKEKNNLRMKAEAAEDYEENVLGLTPFKRPETLKDMIKMKLIETNKTMNELAGDLKMNPAKVSLILNKKQNPDVTFLKGIRKVLKIDADFILDHA